MTKSDNPKISIIIRTKNEEKWLKACLTAISRQTYVNHEVVLVDNNSEDKTVEIANSFGVQKFVTIDDYNPGQALNLGVASSSGAICVFLSAHCIPAHKNWLVRLCSPILSGKVLASYGRQIPTSNTSADNRRDLLMTFGKEPHMQRLDFKFHNANSAIATDTIKKYPFSETISNVEDWLWASKMIEKGNHIQYVADAEVFHDHGLNQHKLMGESFRAKPVAQLLEKMYSLEDHPQEFLDYKNWNGLVIAADPTEEDIRQLIKQLPNYKIISTGKYDKPIDYKDYYHMNSDDSLDFLGFLKMLLSEGEQKFNQLFDYVIFIDFKYSEIDFDLVVENSSNLFEFWSDIASAARKIKGKCLEYTSLNSNFQSAMFPTNAEASNLVELTLGQCSAIRCHILRNAKYSELDYRVTRLVDNKQSQKIFRDAH